MGATIKIGQRFIPTLRMSVKGELECDAGSHLDIDGSEALAETVEKFQAHGQLLDLIGWEVDAPADHDVDITFDRVVNRSYMERMITEALHYLSDRVGEACGDSRDAEPAPDAMREHGEALYAAAQALEEVQTNEAAV